MRAGVTSLAGVKGIFVSTVTVWTVPAKDNGMELAWFGNQGRRLIRIWRVRFAQMDTLCDWCDGGFEGLRACTWWKITLLLWGYVLTAVFSRSGTSLV